MNIRYPAYKSLIQGILLDEHEIDINDLDMHPNDNGCEYFEYCHEQGMTASEAIESYDEEYGFPNEFRAVLEPDKFFGRN